MANLDVFITNIINLCKGDFVKTFDQDKDGVVTKSEFQNVCLTSGTLKSGQRDIIDDFWNSIDFNCGDGKIKGTNCFNYNALDGSELLGVDKELKLTGQISGHVENILNRLKGYPNTYEYLLGKSIEHLKGLGITDEDELITTANSYVQELINRQTFELREAMIKDAISIIIGGTEYKKIEGYDPYNDKELLSRIGEVVDEENFINAGDDPIQAIIDYFTNSEEDSDINQMKTTATNYFSGYSNFDYKNNYQRARISALYTEQAQDSIKKYGLSNEQIKNAEAKLKDVIPQATDEIFNTLNGSTMSIDEIYGKASQGNTQYALNNTDAGIKFDYYLYTLSLGDFDEKNDESFFEYFVSELMQVCDNEVDARAVAEYLAENDVDIDGYQKIVNAIAEDLYYPGKYTNVLPNNEGLIIQAVIYGLTMDEKGLGGLGSGENLDSIIDDLIDKAGITSKEINWLCNEIFVKPNETATTDVVDVYVNDNGNDSRITYDASVSVSQSGVNAKVSIDNNGVLKIEAGGEPGYMTIQVDVKYEGKTIETKTIDIAVTAINPNQQSLNTDDWAKKNGRSTGEGYTKNNYSDQDEEREECKQNVRATISDLYSFLSSETQKVNNYDTDALSEANNLTQEFFDILLDEINSTGDVRNSTGKHKNGWNVNAEFNMKDGTKCTVKYNRENHQGYIDADKNKFDDGDNVEWIRGTMAGARFAKIGVKNSFIVKVFNLFYNRCLNGESGNISL